MARKLKLPVQNQLAVATIIDFILAHADGKQPQSKAQRAVASKLTKLDPNRKICQKLAQNFKQIPAKNRVRAFGKFEPGKLNIAKAAEKGALAASPTLTVPMLKKDDVGDPIIPTFPDGTEFSILYTGLYCRENSGDRWLVGPSDETYVITAVVSIENGQNITRDELHPVGDPDKHYDDVDDGESREGPIAAVWHGTEPTSELSLVTVVMEHDEGDPDFYREEIATIVGAAAAVAAAFGLVVPALIIAAVGVIVNWLIDTGDDVLGTSVRIISPDSIKHTIGFNPTTELIKERVVIVPISFGNFVEQTVIDETGLQHHFAEQVKDEAEYFVTFKYSANQEPVDQVDLKDLHQSPFNPGRVVIGG